jgi:hypothetical protein
MFALSADVMKMTICLPLAIAAMLSAEAAIAQPAKGDSKVPVAAPQPPAKVVLASAEDVRAPASTGQPTPAAVKRPVPRVTTCRCGDQQPDQDQQPDE